MFATVWRIAGAEPGFSRFQFHGGRWNGGGGASAHRRRGRMVGVGAGAVGIGMYWNDAIESEGRQVGSVACLCVVVRQRRRAERRRLFYGIGIGECMHRFQGLRIRCVLVAEFCTAWVAG